MREKTKLVYGELKPLENRVVQSHLKEVGYLYKRVVKLKTALLKGFIARAPGKAKFSIKLILETDGVNRKSASFGEDERIEEILNQSPVYQISKHFPGFSDLDAFSYFPSTIFLSFPFIT